MAKYKVIIAKEWIEYGTIEIEADSEQDARAEAMELVLDGNDGIQWGDMDPQGERVDSVEEIEP